MDTLQTFLLNPNVVYLVLVLGFLLAIMALLSPGTAVLEVLALFSLIFAGYGIYNLTINLWALLILLLGVIPILLVVRKFRRPIFLLLSIFSLAVGSSFLFRGDSWWQPAVDPFLAIVVSMLAGGYVWVITTKTLEVAATPPAHDLSVLIGQIGEAKTDIHQEGSVQVAGELWSAYSDRPIRKGSRVRVLEVQGFILHVDLDSRYDQSGDNA